VHQFIANFFVHIKYKARDSFTKYNDSMEGSNYNASLLNDIEDFCFDEYTHTLKNCLSNQEINDDQLCETAGTQ